MKKAELKLPEDLYVPSDQPGEAWNRLGKADAESRLKRMDIVAKIWADELPKGQAGLVERISKRLALENSKASKTIITDSIGIFKTFRLGEGQGLNYSREALLEIPISRLRAIARRSDWALRHAEEVPHLLTLQEEGENGIVAYMEASEPRNKEKKKPAFAKVTLTFTNEDVVAFKAVLGGIQAKGLSENRTYSDKEDIRSGQLVMEALMDWVTGDNTNAQFVSLEGLADDEEQQEAAD